MYEPFFHVGVLVHDIEAAADDFHRLLGLEFEPTRVSPVATGETMRFRYSLQGPPFLELVQITGDGIWGPANGEGLHHIAFGDPDIPGRCLAWDNQATSVVEGADGASKVIFTHPEALHGIRVEFLQSAMVAATFDRMRVSS